jgi:hypothetical protein
MNTTGLTVAVAAIDYIFRTRIKPITKTINT